MQDIFTRFNRKGIEDRQIDTLIGLSKGLVADGRVTPEEAEFLQGWLIQARQAAQNPIIVNLFDKVDSFLKDGVLDESEAEELLTVLHQITGAPTVVGELARAMSLPVNQPQPQIAFPERTFAFTGTCAFGTRKECQRATEALGGINAKSVTWDLHYLVIGSYVTDSWAHESFGRKIEKAMGYRDKGAALAIITEEHWARHANLI